MVTRSAAQPPPPRLTRAESKAKTRREILDAAERVFRRDGYHGVSLDRVAAQAGFTKGAVYSTFESKADLFLALLARRAAGRRADIEAVLAEAESVEDFTAEVARRFARSVSSERDFWAALIEFMTVVGRDRALRPRFAEHHDATRESVGAAMSEWARRNGGRLAIEPRRLGTAVLALTNGLTLEGLLAPDEVDMELYVDVQLALLRGMLATDRRTATAATDDRGREDRSR